MKRLAVAATLLLVVPTPGRATLPASCGGTWWASRACTIVYKGAGVGIGINGALFGSPGAAILTLSSPSPIPGGPAVVELQCETGSGGFITPLPVAPPALPTPLPPLPTAVGASAGSGCVAGASGLNVPAGTPLSCMVTAIGGGSGTFGCEND